MSRLMFALTCRTCGERIRICECGASGAPHWVGAIIGTQTKALIAAVDTYTRQAAP